MIAPRAIAHNRGCNQKALQINCLDWPASATAARSVAPSSDPGQAAGIVKASAALA
jgi:hypothetical protein